MAHRAVEKEPEGEIRDEVTYRFRTYRGKMLILIHLICISFVVFLTLYLLGLLNPSLVYLFPVQVYSIGMAFVFTLTFLLVPATKNGPWLKMPWYDMLLILAGVIPSIYLLLIYNAKLNSGLRIIQNSYEFALALLLIISLLEATRRTMGWISVGCEIAFTIYPLISHLLPGVLKGRHFSLTAVLSYFYFT